MNLNEFRYQTIVTVRFADLDAMGHLNHAKYLTYMEQARILYIRDICGWEGGWGNMGMILAKASVDYLLPVGFDEQIAIYTRCSRLGTKSFDLDYILKQHQADDTGKVVATGHTVMVAYDYDRAETIPVPEHWRKQIRQYEPIFP